MKLAEKQGRWRRQTMSLERRTRRSEKNQCRDKFRHLDFLSAMQHARGLELKEHKLFTVYECIDCGHTHVGRAGGEFLVWMMGPYSETIRL